jgi:hypothetical protein
MGDPMPTVVSKGYAGVFLDAKYVSAQARWADLDALRNGQPLIGTLMTGPTPAGMTAAQKNSVATALGQWFSAGANKWNYYTIGNGPNYTVTDVKVDQGWANLDHAKNVVTAGIIRALEVSLRLGPGDSPPGNPPQLNDRGPLRLHWVCGKGDGFDVQVAWSESAVDCFIVTPPIRLPVTPLSGASTSWTHGGGAVPTNLASAMKNDPAGMLLVNSTTVRVPGPIRTALMHAFDGGLTL